MVDPDLSLGGLAIQIAGSQSDASRDYWDSNWLFATIECQASGAHVVVEGSVIHRVDLDQWLSESEELVKQTGGTARLVTMEENLAIDLRLNRLGQLDVEIEVTPDPLNQRHYFKQELDRTYLVQFVRDLRQLLERYPQRGSRPEHGQETPGSDAK